MRLTLGVAVSALLYAAPLAVEAQPGAKVHRIGILETVGAARWSHSGSTPA